MAHLSRLLRVRGTWMRKRLGCSMSRSRCWRTGSRSGFSVSDFGVLSGVVSGVLYLILLPGRSSSVEDAEPTSLSSARDLPSVDVVSLPLSASPKPSTSESSVPSRSPLLLEWLTCSGSICPSALPMVLERSGSLSRRGSSSEVET